MKFYELITKIILFDKKRNIKVDVCYFFSDNEKGDFIKRIVTSKINNK